jgi:hypothetical protein
MFSQNDPDAYSFSGGLNRTTQGLTEFVEMFKAPIKMLHPLLTAMQEGNYAGTENIGGVPYQGIILSRLKTHENSNLHSKRRVYDGESLKDTDPRAKSAQEYRDAAGVDEGMDGISTRFAFKVLSGTFNFDTQEIAADPVHLMYVLEQSIWREQFPEESEKKYLIKAELAPAMPSSSAVARRSGWEGPHPDCRAAIGPEIQKAYLESYSDYGQNLFDRYVAYADAWIEDQDYKDAIPTRGISEPIFHHNRRTGRTDHVVPGNKEYVRGDEIPRPTGGEGRGGSEGSPDGSGEDAFEFTLSKEEFLDMFFEDLELPDLVKKSLKDTTAVDLQRALHGHRQPRKRHDRSCSLVSCGRGCRVGALASKLNPRSACRGRDVAIRVAINGFGRIGRLVMRAALEHAEEQLKIVGINDLGPVETNAHLLRYDREHGRFAGEVTIGENWMVAGRGKIRVTAERDPAKLPWKELGSMSRSNAPAS